MNTKTLAVWAIVPLLGCSVFGAEGKWDRFAGMDKNADGSVSETEWQKKARQRQKSAYDRSKESARFAQADRDQNQKLSREELETFFANEVKPAKGAWNWFTFFDTNKDGQVTEAEYLKRQQKKMKAKFNEAKVMAMFKKRDLNGDGIVTKEEDAGK